MHIPEQQAKTSEGHTAGPWIAAMQYGQWYVRQDPADWNGMGYQHVCSLPADRKGTWHGDMFKANARLIAAAPDLLSALQEIADESVFNQQRFAEDTDTDYFLRCFKAVKDRARAALAKAQP